MAGCFIASVPVVVVYNFCVDRFIAGFTVGAIR
jgi:multiple sugar transport system permease protein